MFFQLATHDIKLCKDIRHRLFHRLAIAILARRARQRQRGPDTSDNVLALRVDQEFAIKAVLAS